jgi:hypothetical protein
VCRPKDQRGLGVHDLEVKKRALLGKWLAKLLTEDIWGLANHFKEELCWLKSDIQGLLETRGLSLLDWTYGDEQVILPI